MPGGRQVPRWLRKPKYMVGVRRKIPRKEMDDDWGSTQFRKPPYIIIIHYISTQKCVSHKCSEIYVLSSMYTIAQRVNNDNAFMHLWSVQLWKYRYIHVQLCISVFTRYMRKQNYQRIFTLMAPQSHPRFSKVQKRDLGAEAECESR